MIAIKKLENQTFELITVITFIDNKTYIENCMNHIIDGCLKQIKDDELDAN